MLPVLSKFWIGLVSIGRNRAAILPGQNMFLKDCLQIKYESLSIHRSGINSASSKDKVNTLVSIVTLVPKEKKVILVMKSIVVRPQISSL